MREKERAGGGGLRISQQLEKHDEKTGARVFKLRVFANDVKRRFAFGAPTVFAFRIKRRRYDWYTTFGARGGPTTGVHDGSEGR